MNMKIMSNRLILQLVFLGGLIILLINILRAFHLIAIQDTMSTVLGIIMGVLLMMFAIAVLKNQKKNVR